MPNGQAYYISVLKAEPFERNATPPFPLYEQLVEVLDAAQRVLAAREDAILTREEWDELERAVTACRQGS